MVTRENRSIKGSKNSKDAARPEESDSGKLSHPNLNTLSISYLLDAVVSTLGRMHASQNDQQRGIFFPDGITAISITLGTGAEKAELKIASESVPRQFPLNVSPSSAEAESCRGELRFSAGDDLSLGEKVPAKSETSASGEISQRIKRTDPEFKTLVKNTNPAIIFKNEEGTDADNIMSQRLKEVLDAIANAVVQEWSDVKLRVTEAWDEDNEHAGNSLHYEGRAADLTTHPIDTGKLGRLGRLAVEAGCDWVWFENSAHIHVSVTKA